MVGKEPAIFPRYLVREALDFGRSNGEGGHERSD